MKNNKIEVTGPFFTAHVGNYIPDKNWIYPKENNQHQYDRVQ